MKMTRFEGVIRGGELHEQTKQIHRRDVLAGVRVQVLELSLKSSASTRTVLEFKCKY
jgi:hypothetical protein